MKVIEWSTMAMREQGIESKRGWMLENGDIVDEHYRPIQRTAENVLEVREVDASTLRFEKWEANLDAMMKTAVLIFLIWIFAQLIRIFGF